MKLINYNYGYNNEFNCSIHGKIIVSKEEWDNIKRFLSRTRKWVYDRGYVWFYKRILKEDLKRFYKVKKGKLYNIRVDATSGVAKEFELDNYKRGNYTFLVKD